MTSPVNLPIGETTMKLLVHEGNSGALVLAKTLSPQFTPQSKYYAIKTIWFCEEIHNCCIQLLKINTVEHLGDIFTKCLVQVTFEYLQKKYWMVSYGTQCTGGLYNILYYIPFRSLHCHEVRYKFCEGVLS